MPVTLPHIFATAPPSPPTPASFLDDNFNALAAGINGITPGLQAPTVNAQTGVSYTFVAGDNGKIVTFSNAAAIAVSLPQATAGFVAPWATIATCLRSSTGAVTITPTTSTIDGLSSIVLNPGAAVLIVSDGTASVAGNYQVSRYFTPPTKAQMQAGTDTTDTVTPAGMNNHDGVAKALVTFTGATAVITGPAGGAGVNVTSVTRNSAGNYTVNFTTNFADATYVPHLLGLHATLFLLPLVKAIAVGTCNVAFVNVATDLVDTDPTTVFFGAHGRQ